jgi:PAS domain S-box-containing protein
MINYNFLKTLNILYIENDKNIKKDFLKTIDGLFNNVICADNASDAINKFIENKNNSFLIDVVISEIDIPVINGIEVLEKIREEDLEIPIILLTNNLEPDKLLQAIKYKAKDYLCKPVLKKELLVSIQKACKVRHYDKFKKDMEGDLEELISAINDVALVSKTDLKGKITFVNKYFCDTVGFTKKEVMGQTHDLIRDDKSNTIQIKELWNTIKLGKVWEGKVRNISKTKEVFFTYLTIIPILDPLDNSIKEYMWIRFLSTEEEIEQNEFKKRVAQNIHSSRRINLEAREEIDRLFKELDICKSIKFIKYSLIEEKKRTSKFINQISFYKKELKNKEKDIHELSNKASAKIINVVKTEKSVRVKKDIAVKNLNELVSELDLKNKYIKSLTKELDNQIIIIEELKVSITKKERKLNLI